MLTYTYVSEGKFELMENQSRCCSTSGMPL